MSADDESRVAMISGANRGIGAGIARHLGKLGWQLSLGVRNPARFGEPPSGALVQAFDAAAGAAEKPWVEATLDRFGRIDAVINNAGIMIPKTVLEIEDAEIASMLQVNVMSPLRLVRAAYPALKASGQGKVVTLASLSGLRVKTAAAGSYSVSKFAALALAHAIRHAGWDDGVRSTAICPGFVASDMSMALTEFDPKAMTQPEDIARIVALLLDLPNTASISEIPVNCMVDSNH